MLIDSIITGKIYIYIYNINSQMYALGLYFMCYSQHSEKNQKHYMKSK